MSAATCSQQRALPTPRPPPTQPAAALPAESALLAHGRRLAQGCKVGAKPGQCSLCMGGRCATCRQDDGKRGYYVTPQGGCKPCPDQFCKTCTANAGACLTCVTGYTFDATGRCIKVRRGRCWKEMGWERGGGGVGPSPSLARRRLACLLPGDPASSCPLLPPPAAHRRCRASLRRRRPSRGWTRASHPPTTPPSRAPATSGCPSRRASSS